MSFTGSTRAGIAVSKDAADTVKRVTLELGGKSPNIVFADADIEERVTASILECFNNSGQSCDAPTRMAKSGSTDETLIFAEIDPQAFAISRAENTYLNDLQRD